MKKLILIFFLFSTYTFCQPFKFGEAKGLFMALGVGPDFPIGNFGDKNNIGTGFNVTISYSDNKLMPIFLYGSVGFSHFPGRQDLYKSSAYSSFSSNVLIFKPGVRYYFPPILENVVLLMPVIDVGMEFGYFENFNQFKVDQVKPGYVEQIAKTGFHAGVGVSMFLLDVITYYNYLPDNQFLSFNLKINIPIFVKI